MEKVSIRYASQFEGRIKELEELLGVVVSDFRNEFHITLEDVVIRAEELINKGK